MVNIINLKFLVSFVAICTLVLNKGFAQQNQEQQLPTSETALIEKLDSITPFILEEKERMPRFPGCEDLEGTNDQKAKCAETKMLEYLYSNLSYPEEAKKFNGQAMVVLKFVIDTTGFIDQVEILRDPGYGFGNEAKRVILSMNQMSEKWTPGFQRGRPVNVWYTLPIKFSYSKPSKKRKK